MFLRQPLLGIDYLPAKLSQGKVWFVYYYVKSPDTGKLRRIRMKVNRGRTKKERLQLARALMSDLNTRLAMGWNPLLEQTAPKAGVPFFQAMEDFLKAKAKESRANSMRSYRSFVGVFRSWLEARGFREENVSTQVSREVCMAFMDDMDARDDVSALTFNNYIRFYGGMFHWMLKKGYIAVNPFEDIERKPKRLIRTKKRRLLTPSEMETLVAFLSKENPPYLAICLFCYCCFMRPKEIAQIRCGDIDLERQLVHVSGAVAKNGHDSERTIPDAMLPYIRRLDLSDPDLYLFAAQPRDCYAFTPGKKPSLGQRIADYWRFVVRPGCRFGEDLQFYSLKDTGITRAISEGVAINYVQQQADHSSVAMTAIYVGKTSQANEALKGVDILSVEKRK